jgi:hypothetical protein
VDDIVSVWACVVIAKRKLRFLEIYDLTIVVGFITPQLICFAGIPELGQWLLGGNGRLGSNFGGGVLDGRGIETGTRPLLLNMIARRGTLSRGSNQS